MHSPPFRPRRRRIAAAIATLALAVLSACAQGGFGGGGASRSAATPVQVALLVPTGSADANVAFIGQSLTNAAQLAAADLQGAEIDLRVYDTAGSAERAGQLAAQAAAEGAEVILGPLYAGSANTAGLAVQNRGLNVLSFSNNPSVAGGNVFILGSTFDTSARRLVGYAGQRGLSRIFIVSGESPAETVGRDAIVRAVQSFGGTQLAGSRSFAMSQQGILDAAPVIAAEAEASQADALFLTSGPESALPFVAQFLPEAGLDPAQVQYMGLTRWDVPASAMALPGLQGGWFTLPDPARTQRFAQRYQAAYGGPPHTIAGLAYDGVAAIGALAAGGRAPTRDNLTQGNGFAGANGAFRLLPDGTNTRSLAVATIRDGQVAVIDPAPRSASGAGF